MLRRNAAQLWRLVQANRAIFVVDQSGRGKADADLRARFQMSDMGGEFAGRPKIVAVEKADIAPSRGGDPAVAGAREAAVCLAYDAEARMIDAGEKPGRLVR